jgi:TRAP-type C4-dicarboxylate transport system permease small subunit
VRLLGRVVDWTVIGIGALMAGLVFFNVCLHLIDKDLAWVTELGELLMVWVTFLGGACAAQEGSSTSSRPSVGAGPTPPSRCCAC